MVSRSACAILLACIAGAGLTFGPPATADDEDPLASARRLVQVVDRIESRYRSLGAFRAPFELSYVSPTFGANETESGTLHVAPPNRMLWLYDQPEGQRAVFDGSTWWLLSPQDRTVTRRQVDPAARSPMVDLLAGDTELLSVFSGRLIDPGDTERPGRVALELLPREPREQVDRVLVTADPDSGTIHRIEVVGPLGGSHVLSLGKPVEEEPLPADRFELEVPEGYTLLEE